MAFLNKNFPQINAFSNTLYRALRLYLSNRSVLAWQQLFSHLCRKVMNQSVPTFMTIGLTYRCQCRCVHCYADAPHRDKDNELETWQVKSVIDQAKRLGVLQVNFSGGDPLLRADIVELVQHAHDAGLLTRINTAGLLLDPQRVSRLKEAGLTQCGVSIDDADPETHDSLRGLPGAHKKALEGMGNLREFNIPCQILTYGLKKNVVSGLKKIIKLGRQYGVLSVFIFFPVAAGRWDQAFDQVLGEEEKAQVRNLQDLTFVHLELPTPRTMCCVFTKSVLYVSPQGDVTPCPFVPYVFGNMRNDTLRDLWHHHCARLSLVYRGDCPLNNIRCREALKGHVESIARDRRWSFELAAKSDWTSSPAVHDLP